MRKTLLALMLGISVIAAAKKPETIEEMKARAEAAKIKKQPELYAKLAKKQVEVAADGYNTNPEQAKQLILDATDSAEKAADASLQSGKREKRTEIDLRELENHIDDVIRSWAFDDRNQVKPVLQRFETARTKLLNRMFRK